MRSGFMNSRSLIGGGIATMSLVWAVHAQTGTPTRPQPAPSPAAQSRPAPAMPAAPPAVPATPASPRPAAVAPAQTVAAAGPGQVVTVDHERAFLKQYCVTCHSDAARAAGMDSARKLQVEIG